MVSFTLDTVKFILIYRYLQNIYWFKRGAFLYIHVTLEIRYGKNLPHFTKHYMVETDLVALLEVGD